MLEPTGMTRVGVPGLGHCGFCAISVCATGSAEKFDQYRKLLSAALKDPTIIDKDAQGVEANLDISTTEGFGAQELRKEAKSRAAMHEKVDPTKPCGEAQWFGGTNNLDAAAIAIELKIRVLYSPLRAVFH